MHSRHCNFVFKYIGHGILSAPIFLPGYPQVRLEFVIAVAKILAEQTGESRVSRRSPRN